MKKIVSLWLCIAVIVGLCSCGKSGTGDKNPPTAQKPATEEASKVIGQTKISDYIRDEKIHATHYLPDFGEFTVQNQALNYRPYSMLIFESSVRNLKMGDTVYYMEKYADLNEWTSNHLLKHYEANPPATRQEAVTMLKEKLLEYVNGKPHPWMQMDSYLCYQHYMAEAGCDYVGVEIGVNVACYAMHMAYARGASRQYNIPWWSDVSMWWGHTMANYSGNPDTYQDATKSVLSEPDAGLPHSLARRAYYLSYLSGSGWLNVEAGANISYYPDIDKNGNYEITPIGKHVQEFYDFKQRNKDIGVYYTPFAVVMDYYHGTAFARGRALNAFETFEYNDGDMLSFNVLNMFSPNCWDDDEDGTKGMTTSPYSDGYDVVLDNVSAEVLNSYRAIILTGDIQFKSGDAQKYIDYANNGGVLILNRAYLSHFADYRAKDTGSGRCDITAGNGKVIIYGDSKYSTDALEGILSELAAEYVPFKISGEVEYTLNIKNGSIILAVFNNKGVTKSRREAKPETIDASQTQEITIEYTGPYDVLQVRNLMTDEVLETNKVQNVTIGPGDLIVLEFVA